MYAPFKVQGSTPLGCKQFLGATPPDEKPTIYPDPCRETFEGAVHGSQGISQGARKLARTAKVIYIYIYIYIYGSTYGNWSFGEVRRTYRWHCGSILEESGIAFHGLFVMMLVMEIESGFGMNSQGRISQFVSHSV
jgi:hypothetical protein